jgi:hypothetical protein
MWRGSRLQQTRLGIPRLRLVKQIDRLREGGASWLPSLHFQTNVLAQEFISHGCLRIDSFASQVTSLKFCIDRVSPVRNIRSSKHTSTAGAQSPCARTITTLARSITPGLATSTKVASLRSRRGELCAGFC